jgi:hypothetical protein
MTRNRRKAWEKIETAKVQRRLSPNQPGSNISDFPYSLSVPSRLSGPGASHNGLDNHPDDCTNVSRSTGALGAEMIISPSWSLEQRQGSAHWSLSAPPWLSMTNGLNSHR